MCSLRHVSLLDAAHILRDRHPQGLAAVSNGMALCKIHHAAYDQNILGIRPDLVVQVRDDILEELDGPMLRHGLQEMAGVRLTTPRAGSRSQTTTRSRSATRSFWPQAADQGWSSPS